MSSEAPKIDVYIDRENSQRHIFMAYSSGDRFFHFTHRKESGEDEWDPRGVVSEDEKESLTKHTATDNHTCLALLGKVPML